MAHNWKLSPSDFAFLWSECRRCFWLKVAGGFPRADTPFPGVFRKIDRIMNEFFLGKDVSEITPDLPAGTVEFGEKAVQSEPIGMPGRASTCFIAGRFDTVVSFRGGGYGVIDFKTSDVKAENLAKYGRQLHAYALALERPAPRRPRLAPVTRLGLYVVEPYAMRREGAEYALAAKPAWVGIRRDDDAFLAFLGEVVDVLDRSDPPPADPDCSWCAYRGEARDRGV